MMNLQTPIVEAALATIKEQGMNLIHCSVTGQEIGITHDAEIVSCLESIWQQSGTFNADNLVDSYTLTYLVASSGICPSLRVHRDPNQWLHILKADSSGPDRLFGYLMGRIFYDQQVPDPRKETSTARFAKLNFLVSFRRVLSKLPAGWYDSLEASDEETKISSELVKILGEAAGIAPTVQEECKYAQRILEALIRLEATTNVRSIEINRKLRKKMDSFADGIDDYWTFRDLDSIINEIEESRIKNPDLFNNRVSENRLLIEVAARAAGWELKRVVALQTRYQETIDKEGERTHKGESIFSRLRSFGLGDEPSQADGNKAGVDLEAIHRHLNSLTRELSIVSWSEKRLEVLKRSVAQSGREGPTIRRSGAAAARALLETGTPMNPDYTLKLMGIVEAGKVKRAGESKASKSAKRPSRSKYQNLFDDIDKAMGDLKIPGKE